MNNNAASSVISKFLWAGGGAAVMATLLYAAMIISPSWLQPLKPMADIVSDKAAPIEKNVLKNDNFIIESGEQKAELNERKEIKRTENIVQQAAVDLVNETEVFAEKTTNISTEGVNIEAEDSPINVRLDKAVSGQIDERVAVTRQWLSSAKDRNYSIQLLMARKSKVAAVEEFLQTLTNSLDVSKIYIYETQLGESSWYCIVYDEFSSYQKAMAALQKLPQSLQESSPYLRRLSTLKREGKDVT